MPVAAIGAALGASAGSAAAVGTIAVGTLAAGVATAGAQAYGANQQAKAAKSAAETQANIAREQMKQTATLQTQATEEAKSKLKLRQASNTNTLLTSPLTPVQDNVTTKSILGV
jgi:hypothetical protein